MGERQQQQQQQQQIPTLDESICLAAVSQSQCITAITSLSPQHKNKKKNKNKISQKKSVAVVVVVVVVVRILNKQTHHLDLDAYHRLSTHRIGVSKPEGDARHKARYLDDWRGKGPQQCQDEEGKPVK